MHLKARLKRNKVGTEVNWSKRPCDALDHLRRPDADVADSCSHSYAIAALIDKMSFLVGESCLSILRKFAILALRSPFVKNVRVQARDRFLRSAGYASRCVLYSLTLFIVYEQHLVQRRKEKKKKKETDCRTIRGERGSTRHLLRERKRMTQADGKC